MKNIFVTGYSAHELGIYDQKNKALKYIRKAFVQKIVPLIEDGLQWIITPGQYGFDLWATEVAIKLRDTRYPTLNISMLHAYMGQEQNWNENKQQYFNKIKQQLDHFDIVSKQPYQGPWQFQARDQIMLNKTDGMLLFYDEEAAASKVKYIRDKALRKAEQEHYPIIAITSDDINNIVEEEQYNEL